MSDARLPMDGAPLRTRTTGHERGALAVLWMLWRRKWIPVMGFILGVALGFAVLSVTPPLYKASAQIMIDTHGVNNGILQSEVQIIKSTPVLSKVAGMLALYRDAEFRRPGLVDSLLHKGNDENALRDRVMRKLDHITSAGVLPDTSIIEMSAHHPNPDRAAQIANALLTAYRERKVDERFEQSRQIGEWMNRRLEEIKAQADDSKQRLADFQATNGLIALGMPDMKAQRLSELNQALGAAQGDVAALSARLEEARNNAGRVNVPALKATEAQLIGELAELQKRYGDKHPKIIAQKKALARVRGDINNQGRNLVVALERDLEAAQGRMATLQNQISDVGATVHVDGRLKLQLKELETDVAVNERLYADFLTKHQDVMAESELRMTDTKVIGMATIPSQPDQGERIKLVVWLGIIGFLLGFATAFLRILLNTGFTHANQLEGMTGYPVFAAVPMAAVNDKGVHHNIAQNPAAILAESLRSLRVALRLRGETGKRPRVIAFTSTLPDEGKTSLAVMLAMIAAKSGERVCIVDCDLRRPSLHKAFGIGNAKGLADYLSDRLGFEDVIYRKDPSGVHLVTAKAVPSYSLTLLTSGRMERFITNLREQYDLVILDAPSSLAFADARVLARMVDQTMYVVAWNRTRRESVLASLKSYADMHYPDLALVLNKVDLAEYLRDSAAAVIYQYGHEQKEQGAAYAT